MKKRINIALSNDSVGEIELLRAKLEQRLMQRLSLAQVVKRLIKMALEEEKVIS